MTLQVFAGISLRTEQGVHFGTLVRIRTGMAGVLTDAAYDLGEALEFQLDLTGFDATVHGLAEVVRAELQPLELNRYLLRIRKMRRTDQALLQEWYGQQQAGREPSLRTADTDQALDSQVESQLPSAVGEGMPAPETPSASKGRAAIRALLLDAAERPLPANDQLGGAAGDPPEIEVDSSVHPWGLVVRYRTRSGWQRDAESLLERGLLFLPLADPHPPLDTPLRVHLLCPPELDSHLEGRVALLHERGVGIVLDGLPAPNAAKGHNADHST